MMKKRKNHQKLFNLALATSLATSAVVAIAPTQIEAAPRSFPDVKPNDYYNESVQILSERGIINGYPDKTFRPINGIEREHVAVILYRAMDLEAPSNLDAALKGYSDVDSSHKCMQRKLLQ